MMRSFRIPSSATKRPRSEGQSSLKQSYLKSVHALCKEKCWSQLAARILPPTTLRDEHTCERGLVANLFSQLDDIGLPINVMVAIVSLSRTGKQRRPPLHRDDADGNGTTSCSFKHWPMHSLPATRHSLRRCRSLACHVHLSLIFQYLLSSSGQCSSGAKRQEVIRMLTAILYLTSDEDTLERMLSLVFDATLMMESAEDEVDGAACSDGSKSATAFGEMNVAPKDIAAQAPTTATMKREKSIVLQRGEFVASKIGDAANWVSHHLEGKVVPTVNNGIDHAGKFVKNTIPPAPGPIIDRRTAVVTKTYTDAVRRSTSGITNTVQVASGVVREGATSVAKIVGECIADEASPPENEEEEQKERRELLAAAGTVGMATVGAVALVGESIIDSSRAVVQKSVNVTADIVRHRHGDDLGKIVEDVFESTGNVMSITRTSFQATHISKAATKNIAKMHVYS